MLDLSAAAEMIKSIQEEFLDERNENTWHEIWKKAEDIRQKLGIHVEEKKTRLSKHSTQDSHILAMSQEHHYRVNLYYQVLDKLLNELDLRFSESNKSLLKAMSALDPTNSKFLDLHFLQPMADQYLDDCSFLEIELKQAKRLIKRKSQEGSTIKNLMGLSNFMHPYKDAFPDVYKLINIALVLPPTSASCERSFSSLKLIKSYPRNTMGDTRVSYLGVLGIHPERAKTIKMKEFVNRFVKQHNNYKI